MKIEKTFEELSKDLSAANSEVEHYEGRLAIAQLNKMKVEAEIRMKLRTMGTAEKLRERNSLLSKRRMVDELLSLYDR